MIQSSLSYILLRITISRPLRTGGLPTPPPPFPACRPVPAKHPWGPAGPESSSGGPKPPPAVRPRGARGRTRLEAGTEGRGWAKGAPGGTGAGLV